MRRNFPRLREGLDIAEKVLRLGKKFRDFFPRKDYVSRIPGFVGYFVREEDTEIEKKVKTLCCTSNLWTTGTWKTIFSSKCDEPALHITHDKFFRVANWETEVSL